jgi:hypothetical protein
MRTSTRLHPVKIPGGRGCLRKGRRSLAPRAADRGAVPPRSQHRPPAWLPHLPPRRRLPWRSSPATSLTQTPKSLRRRRLQSHRSARPHRAPTPRKTTSRKSIPAMRLVSPLSLPRGPTQRRRQTARLRSAREEPPLMLVRRFLPPLPAAAAPRRSSSPSAPRPRWQKR